MRETCQAILRIIYYTYLVIKIQAKVYIIV